MPDISQLTASAAKLALHRIIEPGAERTAAAEMRAIGTTNKGSYYAARRQLTDLGLFDEYGNCTFQGPEIVPIGTKTPPQGTNSAPGGTETAPTSHEIVPTPGTEILPLKLAPLSAVLFPAANATGTQTAIPDEVLRQMQEVSEPSLQTRIVEADRMPADGDPSQRTSNFQARRRAQVPLLIEAFTTLLPSPRAPVAESIIKLLPQAGNNAEAIYDAIVIAASRGKKIDSPLGYVASIVRAEAAKAPVPSSVGTMKPQRETDGDEPGQGGFNGIVYRERTDEERAWSQREKARLNKKYGLTEDDWTD